MAPLMERGQYFKQVGIYPHQYCLPPFSWPCSCVTIYLTKVLLLPFFKKLQFNQHLTKVKLEFNIQASLSPPSIQETKIDPLFVVKKNLTLCRLETTEFQTPLDRTHLKYVLQRVCPSYSLHLIN